MQERFESLTLSQPVESAFAGLDATALRMRNAMKALAVELQKFEGAAQKGNISNLRKAKANLRSRFSELSETAKLVNDTDVESIARQIGSQSYLEEIVQKGSQLGLKDLRISRNAILSYPHRVLFDSAATYRLGYRAASDLRPSVIAKSLKEERDRVASIAPNYLESVRAAYLLITKGEAAISVALPEIYNALTLLPATKKAYSEGDFIRDISILDDAGPKVTKDGFRISFPASTSARLNRGFTGVNSKGHEVPYASIRFDKEIDTP